MSDADGPADGDAHAASAAGDGESGPAEPIAVRVRGIYATALTRLFRASDDPPLAVVDASPPIERRFDADFGEAPADVSVSTTRDRQGVQVGGDPAGVEAVRERLAAVALDALAWPDPAPRGAVCNGVVAEERGGGAGVELPGGATGYLPYDAVDGYVGTGDRLRVQVAEPSPPWGDFDARLRTDVGVASGLVELERGAAGVRAAGDEADATALARTTELLDAAAPEGWGVRWRRGAIDAGHDALGAVLEGVAGIAREIEDALADAATPEDAAPHQIATPRATSWVWFGRESRFALDGERRAVTTTLPGHHRIKAAADSASLGVDLAEALASGDADDATDADAFPFDAVASTLGPQAGDEVAIEHGKPDGRLYSLGRGAVAEYDPDGAITLRREITGAGEYDALGTAREPGDAAISKFREGRWWYPTTYRGEDGRSKGTYVNVCTPVELFPDAVRYVDLHVDVIDRPGGEVRVVDEDELAAAVAAGDVSEQLAERARAVAQRVERALSD